jgi:hypothetical protein
MHEALRRKPFVDLILTEEASLMDVTLHSGWGGHGGDFGPGHGPGHGHGQGHDESLKHGHGHGGRF